MKFLEIYLLGELNVDEAMISAGYVGYHPKSLYRLGRKIVEKFENQGGDHRKIARAIGAGEVTILRGLLELAKGRGPSKCDAGPGRRWPPASALRQIYLNHINKLAL